MQKAIINISNWLSILRVGTQNAAAISDTAERININGNIKTVRRLARGSHGGQRKAERENEQLINYSNYRAPASRVAKPL